MSEIVIHEKNLSVFWKGVYPDGMTIQDVLNELSDFHMIMDHVPKVYDHVTGGAASKIHTDADVIISLSDDAVTRTVEENLEDAIKVISEVYDIPLHELRDCV